MKTSVLPSFPGSAWERAIEALPLVENGARYELKPTRMMIRGRGEDDKRMISAINVTCQTTSDRVLLKNISWPTYVAMLAEMGEDRVTRVAYDRGMLEIMSPSFRHENWKRVIENLIVILATELKLNLKTVGSVTCNRPDLRRGAEPDSGFYIQNEPLMRNKKELDLTKDPPPDLVLEVDYTSSSVDRQIIYARGVPELWRYEEQVMQIYQLQAGRYVPCTGSPTFANLPLREIPRFLEKSWEIGELPMMESFKAWVRQQLAELP